MSQRMWSLETIGNRAAIDGSMLLSLREAAGIAGARLFAIQRAAKAGKLFTYRLGALIMVRLEDVERYAAARRAPNGHPRRRPHHTDKGFTWATQKAYDAANRAARANPTPSATTQPTTPPDLDASDYEDSDY